MRSLSMKMKQPKSIDELYRKARYILLYCYVNTNHTSCGNPYNPRRFYVVKDWGSFIIKDNTIEALNKKTPLERIEIPKYALFNHS